MSLDWKFENGAPVEQYPSGAAGMNVVTQTVVFSTMFVGIGTLDEANLPEFWARVDLYQRIVGPLVTQTRPLTLEDLRAHLGLRTNVFPKEPRAKWLSRIAKRTMDGSAYEAREALRAGAKS